MSCKKHAIRPCVIAFGVALCFVFPSRAYGLAESTGPDGSNAQAVHALGELGQGVNVALISSGNARATHEAFADANGLLHLFVHDFTGAGIYTTNHETWMAGIIASRGGFWYPDDIGVAPAADIHSARVAAGSSILFSDLEDALEDLINNENCRVVVTGIALNPTADGQSIWTMLYDYYAYEYNAIFANPAGNYIYDSNGTLIRDDIVVFGDCYNGITTGGLRVTEPDVYDRVGTVSSLGPTADGRRKPDVVGPSQDQTIPHGNSDTSWFTWSSSGGETSFSVPHTAGLAALLLRLADQTPEPYDSQNQVIKAVILNSTFPNIDDKSGNPTNPADSNNVWHPHRGYGRTDALSAYQILQAGRFFTDEVITADKGWAYDSIKRNKEHVYYLDALKDYRLVLTVTWNREIKKWLGSYSEGAAFNLDLTIKDPNELVIFTEAAQLNNLEKVDLLLPTDGTYHIYLKNTTRTTRDYALAFELRPFIQADFDLNYIVDYNDLNTFVSDWLKIGSDLETNLLLDDPNDPNDRVNMRDFSILANQWLTTDDRYCVGQ